MGGGNVIGLLATVLMTVAMVSRGVESGGWCVCKSNLGQDVLQKTLDYACGAGADCNPLKTSGSCFAPNTVLAHCSYAVNSYYQRKSQAQGSCDFSGAATVTGSNPSSSSTCPYPSSGTTSTSTSGGSSSSSSSSSSSGGSMGTVPVSSSSGTVPGSTSTSTTNPYSTTTPNSSILGGMGPTGPNMDDSAALIATPTLFPIIMIILLIMFSRGA